MKTKIYLNLYCLAAFFLLLTTNKILAQTAICKPTVTIGTSPWTCDRIVLPQDLDNGSYDYDNLVVNQNYLTSIGTYTMTLVASKNSGTSSTCTSVVQFVDVSAPVVVAKQNIVVELNAQNIFNLLPTHVDNGSYDHCSNVTLTVNPSVINCGSDNPVQVILRATDLAGNYNETWTYVTVKQNKNRVKNLTCNDLTYINVPQIGQVEITADKILEGGPYGCPYYYEVDLSYNSIPLNFPIVNINDAGKKFTATVTDPETGNKCWGMIQIFGIGCDSILTICDTLSRCHPIGNCNSGHTLLDDVEWPCDLEILNAPNQLISNPTPQALAKHLNVTVASIKPIFNIGNCVVLGESISDYSYLDGTKVVLRRKYSYINWSDPSNPQYSYTQTINFYPILLACDVCDTKAWDTPVGDCTSGHTLSDAVEWPADITVDYAQVSPYDLSLDTNVHANNVAPVLRNACVNWSKTYNDVVETIDPTHLIVKRNWTIINWDNSRTYDYLQKIFINSTAPNERTFCFHTRSNIPIEKVKILNGVESNTDPCMTLPYNQLLEDIKPEKQDDDYQAGLDIEDLIMMKEHILSVRQLDVLEDMASQLNNDIAINNSDFSLLEKLYSEEIHLQKNAWQFINTNNYFTSNNTSSQVSTKSPYETYHFTGIKLGDINDSYNRIQPLPISNIFTLQDQIMNAGEAYNVKIKNAESLNLKGFQMLIAKDNNFELTSAVALYYTVKVVDKGDHYLVYGIADDTSLKFDGKLIESNSPFVFLTVKSKVNTVLSKVLKLHNGENKIVEFNDHKLSKISLEIQGQIPTNTKSTALDKIQLYPNPTSDIIYINHDDAVNISSIQIRSQDGSLVQNIKYDESKKIDLSNLATGFYVLQFNSADGQKSFKKVVKM